MEKTTTTSRRRIQDIVTEESIAAMRHEINYALTHFDRELPRTDNQSEVERRHAIYIEAARKVTAGALVYVKERDRAAFAALTAGCFDYVSDRIKGIDAPFVPHAPRRHEDFWSQVEHMHMLGAHRDLTRRIRDAIRALPRLARPRRLPGMDRAELLHAGNQYQKRLATQRAEALCAAVRSRYDESLREEQRAGLPPRSPSDAAILEERVLIDLPRARAWVRKYSAPAALSRLVVAQMFGKSERMVKKLLTIAARQDRENREIRKNWRAPRTLPPSSVNPPPRTGAGHAPPG